MTTPLEAIDTPKKEQNPLDAARIKIGGQRGKQFLELIATGDRSGLASFVITHLNPRSERRNYGPISEAFGKVVGESLARDYAGMFEEINSDNVKYFRETRLSALPKRALPFEVRTVMRKTLEQLYQS